MIVAFIIGATATALMLPDMYAYSSASNGKFDPDESCLFDVDQPKCTPPEGVECPDNFGTNEDGQCFPLDENGNWTCPEGYHNEDDDETGQCYSNDQECPPGMIFEEGTGDGDDSDSCRSLYYICDEEEHRQEDYCIEFCEDEAHVVGCNREA
jgi:hypothetical protein